MTQTQKKHKNPPLAKAIRSFVTGMELPPPNHTDSNYKYAALISAMLQFSGHLKEDSDRAFCTPSQPQLAAYMHCDERTIRRILKELVDIGKIVVHQRQHNSNQYVIFKTFAAYKATRSRLFSSLFWTFRVDKMTHKVSSLTMNPEWTLPLFRVDT